MRLMPGSLAGRSGISITRIYHKVGAPWYRYSLKREKVVMIAFPVECNAGEHAAGEAVHLVGLLQAVSNVGNAILLVPYSESHRLQ